MIKVGEELPSAKLFKLGEKGIDTIESTEYLADKKDFQLTKLTEISNIISIMMIES